MAMLSPDTGKPQRDVTESQFPTGLYLVRLAEVREVGPSAKFPGGNPRLVFDFEVADGPFKGKRSAIFVGKTLFKDPKSGKESNLVKLARSMGVVRPEQGFDPDTLVGKHYQAMCEQDTSTPDGRTWVRTVIPAAGPGGAPAAPAAPAPGAPRPPAPPPPAVTAQRTEPADDSRWSWYEEAAQAWHAGTAKEFRAWMNANGVRADAVFATPEGGTDSRPASEHGFEVIPF